MYFDTYGPFEIDRDDGNVTGQQDIFWSLVRASSEAYGHNAPDLEGAIGCYVFAVKNGSSIRPWYVGMTLAKRGFRGEIFQKHKRDHYNTVLEAKKGKPVMFLMPLLTPEGSFSRDRTGNIRLVQWAEKMLFGVALKRNPECRNQRDTRFLRNVIIHGVFNSRPVGRPGPEARAVRLMFEGS